MQEYLLVPLLYQVGLMQWEELGFGWALFAGITLLAVLLLLKRTRLVGLGMAAPETNVLR